MAFYRNVAGQAIGVFAYDKTTGLPKTGDAANITAYLRKDTGSPAATDATNPTEVDATNMKGWYEFTMTQSESDAERLTLAPVSATANILIEQVQVFTADSTVATAAALQTVDGIVDDILDDTGTTLPATLANLALEATAQSILTDTGTTLPGQIAGLNDLSAAQVNAEVDTALADYDAPTKAELDSGLAGLNDLDATEVQTAAAAALTAYDPPTKAELDAADDAVLAAIAALNNLSSAGAQAAAAAALTAYGAATAGNVAALAAAVWDEVLSGHLTAGSTGAGLNAAGAAGDPWATTLPGSYTGEQAGAIVDRIDSQLLTAGAALVSVITDGDSITAIRGDEFSLSFTSLGSVSGRSKLWFTVKTRTSHGDDDAMIQIAESGGLLFIAGAAAETAANGALTVTDQNDGDMTITLDAAETAKMPVDRALYYDVQVLGSGGVQTLTAGMITFAADVTRATS